MLTVVEIDQTQWDKIVASRLVRCINDSHSVKVFRRGDTSVDIACRNFGLYDNEKTHEEELGCKKEKRRCTWFYGG